MRKIIDNLIGAVSGAVILASIPYSRGSMASMSGAEGLAEGYARSEIAQLKEEAKNTPWANLGLVAGIVGGYYSLMRYGKRTNEPKTR